MAKCFVIAGHGAGDPGACANGYQEATQVRKLAQRMAAIGGSDVIVGDMNRNWYADNGIGRGNCPAGVPVIELHMDSAAAGARGGHVIIKAGFSADSIDNALAKFIGEFFPGRSKTLVGRSDLANPNRAAANKVNYRLVECGFISNKGDADKFEAQIDELAKGILSCFGISSNGSAPAPSPTPSPSPAPAPAPAPAPKPNGAEHSGTGFDGVYRCNVSVLNVRTAPTVNSGTVATYKQGMTVTLDDWYKIADGYVWGRYTGGSGNKRYVAVGKATGKPESGDFLVKVGGSAPAPSVNIDQMARDVIDGKYGSGEARKKALGANYDAVQKRVNEILGGGGSNKKSIDTIAREVIAGKWGNEPQRSQKLRAAGYDPAAVQRRVNQML